MSRRGVTVGPVSGPRFVVEPTIQALLRDLGVRVGSVLKRAALPGDLFVRRPIELTPDEYYRLWRAFGDEAAADDRVLAVDIGNAISVEMFSPPIFAALCSADLATAAQRLADHKPLIGPVTIDVTEQHGELVISFVWPTPPDPPALLATSELIFWVALARIATREPVRPTRFVVPERPDGRRVLEHHLGCRISIGDGYEVRFASADAHRPFLTENDQMWQALAPALQRRLHELDATATTSDRVRAALLEALPAGDPSIRGVTDRLATSARTLQRQLGAEGTTFQAVLASTREDLARHYLADQGLRTTDVAYLLGYDDTNSFFRAFKTWTGTTPERFRARAADDEG